MTDTPWALGGNCVQSQAPLVSRHQLASYRVDVVGRIPSVPLRWETLAPPVPEVHKKAAKEIRKEALQLKTNGDIGDLAFEILQHRVKKKYQRNCESNILQPLLYQCRIKKQAYPSTDDRIDQ